MSRTQLDGWRAAAISHLKSLLAVLEGRAPQVAALLPALKTRLLRCKTIEALIARDDGFHAQTEAAVFQLSAGAIPADELKNRWDLETIEGRLAAIEWLLPEEDQNAFMTEFVVRLRGQCRLTLEAASRTCKLYPVLQAQVWAQDLEPQAPMEHNIYNFRQCLMDCGISLEDCDTLLQTTTENVWIYYQTHADLRPTFKVQYDFPSIQLDEFLADVEAHPEQHPIFFPPTQTPSAEEDIEEDAEGALAVTPKAKAAAPAG